MSPVTDGSFTMQRLGRGAGAECGADLGPCGSMSGLERLDLALVTRGLVRSRAEAQRRIDAGDVTVDGEPVTKPATKVARAAVLDVRGERQWVSRAALKLVDALDGFGIDPAGRLALDVGASTGGFTEVLLDRGARHVIAVDVGHDQFALDPASHSVTVIEGLNVRDLPSTAFESIGRPDLVTIDVSFISLTLVLGPVLAAVQQNADIIALVKPQFEVGRTGVKGGIVVDDARRETAVGDVLRYAATLGLGVKGVRPSPIEGTHGNREVLVHFAADGTDPTEWSAQLAHAVRASTR